jgi:hypothetical protein
MEVTNDLLNFDTITQEQPLTVWDIENNEKNQLITHIENKLLEKLMPIITEKDVIIKQLENENSIIKSMLNNFIHETEEENLRTSNLLENIINLTKTQINEDATLEGLIFDLALKNSINISKYEKLIFKEGNVIPVEYIDYSVMAKEIAEGLLRMDDNIFNCGICTKVVTKDPTKTMYIPVTEIEHLKFGNKLLKTINENVIPYEFLTYVKTIKRCCYYYQVDKFPNTVTPFKIIVYRSSTPLPSCIATAKMHRQYSIDLTFI